MRKKVFLFYFSKMYSYRNFHRLNTIKDHHLFFILNLICCKFVALKENAFSLFSKSLQQTDQVHSSKYSLQRNQDFSLREGLGGDSHLMPKILNLLLQFDVIPHQEIEYPPFLYVSPRPCFDRSPHVVSLVSFRHILLKTFPAVCIFSFIIMIYLKSFIGIKSINTNQCLEGLPPRIIAHSVHFPFYEKIPPFLILLCCPHQVLTSSPLSSNLCRKPWGWSKNPGQQPKNCAFPALETSPSPKNNFM